jgi:hypothetical protein
MQYGESVTPETYKIEVNRPCIVCGSGDVGYPGDFIPLRCGCGCGLIYNMICKGFYVEKQG